MTAPDPRLLLSTTRVLLEGWCGPGVLVGGPPRFPPPAYVPVLVDGDNESIVLLDGGSVIYNSAYLPVVFDEFDEGMRPMGELTLDLSRAECRDRVVRVLAAELFRNVPPNGDGFSWRCDMTLCWEIRSHNLNWRAGFAPDVSGWVALDEGNRTGRFPARSVPALAGLSADDTRLPDGSRLVDALALAAVARHVLGGTP